MDFSFDGLDQNLGHCLFRLSQFEIYFVLCAGVKHQVPDVLLRLKMNGTYQTPINKNIPVLCSTPSTAPPLAKRSENVSLMHDNYVNDDKEDIELPAVYNCDFHKTETPRVTYQSTWIYTRAGERHILSKSVIYCESTRIYEKSWQNCIFDKCWAHLWCRSRILP